MGFEDRDYYRDGPRPPDGFFGRIGHWVLYGRVSLFRVAGIHVQAHSSLLIVMVLMLILRGERFQWQDALISSGLLFVVVLLHEFGHCFGCRWVGGDADEIVMHPLGGLALCRPPSTWRAHLVTSAAGPAVNVAFCIACGLALYLMTGRLPWKPFLLTPWQPFAGWTDPVWLLFWFYQTNWVLLLFNLLPIYPLDGGQITQAALWPKFGYYKSMLLACNTGMGGAVVLGMLGIATGGISLLLIAVFGFMACAQMKRALLEAGPYGFGEYDDPFTQSLATSQRADARDAKRARAIADRQAKRAETEREERVNEEAEIDRILAKVSASGMHSLHARRATDAQERDRTPATTRRRAAVTVRSLTPRWESEQVYSRTSL